MNRKDVRDLVIETTGRTDKDALINSAINIALRTISAKHLWNELLTEASVTLVVDAVSASLASDAHRVSEVRLIDALQSRAIQIRPKTWVTNCWPSPTDLSSAKPAFGYIQGTTLHFVPPTDTAYVVTYSYYKIHADLSDDTTAITLLAAEDAIISYATYWTLKSLQLHDDAAKWLIDFGIQLRDSIRLDRDNATTFVADQRYGQPLVSNQFWLDPFVKTTP